jgi:hypothetical protein
MAREAIKTEFVAARFTKAERRKILKLSLLTDQPGNISAGLRLAVSQAKAPASRSEQPGHESAEAVQYA